VGTPCWANGASVGDYNNDGWPDLLVTCLSGVVLYRNNRDGTFTDVTKSAGLGGDSLWATGAAFGDYDSDGWDDLFVSHYVDIDLTRLDAFGSRDTCRYMGIDVQCGPRGLKGSPDNLYHNNHDGTFTDVSKRAGVSDPEHRFGLTAIWCDFNNDGKLDLLVTTTDSPITCIRETAMASLPMSDSRPAWRSAPTEPRRPTWASRSAIICTRAHFDLISHFDDEYAALYRNDGDMNFTEASAVSGIARSTSGQVGWGDAFVDFANNGWQDIFLVNGHVYPQVDQIPERASYHQPKLLFLNQRNGAFKDISQSAGDAIRIPQVSRGMAIGDLFNDGHLEAVVEKPFWPAHDPASGRRPSQPLDQL